MKLTILSCAAVAIALAALDSEAGGRRGGSGHSAGGHHHRHHVRGGFIVYPRAYWWPGYVAVPAAVVPLTEPYWYYCAERAAYYPHVQDCPSGWQPVRPASPPPPLG